MGGLSRKSAYIKSLSDNKIDLLIIDAGDALFEQVTYEAIDLPNAQYKAEAFLEGMGKIGCDAFNIGEYDLAGGYDFLKTLEKKSDIPFLSANLYSYETGDPAFNPYLIIKKNDLRIGIIGVTDNLSSNFKELYKTEYIAAGKKYINELRDKVDILVMLVNGSINNRNLILESFKDADYIYLSRTVMNTRTTANQMEGLPIFYTIGLNGKYLIHVKTSIVDNTQPVLDVTAFENRIASLDRQLKRLKKTEEGQTLEEKYSTNPQVLTQLKNYEDQVIELQNKIDTVVNQSECQIVPLVKNMDYDLKMQKFVDEILNKNEQ